MGRTYNHIYNILVTEKNGLPGIVAYHLYKKHKVEKIKNFKNTNNGGEPKENFYKEFKDDSLKRVNEYLIAADEETNRLVDNYLKKSNSDILFSLLTASIQKDPSNIKLLFPEGITPQPNSLDIDSKKDAQPVCKQQEENETKKTANKSNEGVKKKTCFIKRGGWYALAMLILTAITAFFTIIKNEEKEVVDNNSIHQSNIQNKPEINITNNIINQNGNNSIESQ